MQLIGVDTGGTFTDAVVLLGDGRESAGKALSTPGALERGVLASISAAAAPLGCSGEEVLAGCDYLAHGTTAGLNALLTRTGARVGLLTTSGFEATVPMARANTVRGISEALRTEAVYWDKPPPLLSRRQIRGVVERVDADGRVVVPLDEEQAGVAIGELGRLGVEAVGVSLLWSHVNPQHEQRVADLVRERLPGIPLTLSSELAPRLGEFERSMTVVLNAYVLPLMAGYVDRLDEMLRRHGFGGVFLLAKNGGGVERARSLASRPVETLNSGPVGGLTAAGVVGRRLGHAKVVATDVGGTSFDVGLVVDGRPRMAPRPLVDRYDVATPMVDVVSIGTGGGSIAWLDAALGALRVGPASAGADPGPACYGRGGTRPTVTDAACVLGYLDRVGDLALTGGAATLALERDVARPMGTDVWRAAEGVLEVACAQMADLVRRTTLLRGHDPAEFVLYAYGGAAPQYVGRYAAQVGVRSAYVPRLASVFSAYGAVASDIRASASLDVDPEPVETAAALAGSALVSLERSARAQLGDADTRRFRTRVRRRAGLRFFRQVHELAVELPGGPVDEAVMAAAAQQFRDRYEALVGAGTAGAGARVELVSLAVDVVVTLDAGRARVAAAGEGGPAVGRRRAWFAGEWVDCPVYRPGHLVAGAVFDGPALVALPTTTVVVGPGQAAAVEAGGHLRMDLGRPGATARAVSAGEGPRP